MKAKKSKQADLESKRPVFFAIGLVVSLSFVLLAFSWKTPVKATIPVGHVDWAAPDEIFIPSTEEKKSEPAPPMMTVEAINLVDNSADVADLAPDIFTSEISQGEGIFVTAMINERKEEVDEQVVFNFAEQMPEFPGGEAALLSFLSKTVKYPVIAQENGIEGTVFIRFVVNTDGSISDAIVVRGNDDSLNKEALRVVNNMPNWKPGMQGGRAVRVNFNVPIKFVLQ